MVMKKENKNAKNPAKIPGARIVHLMQDDDLRDRAEQVNVLLRASRMLDDAATEFLPDDRTSVDELRAAAIVFAEAWHAVIGNHHQPRGKR